MRDARCRQGRGSTRTYTRTEKKWLLVVAHTPLKREKRWNVFLVSFRLDSNRPVLAFGVTSTTKCPVSGVKFWSYFGHSKCSFNNSVASSVSRFEENSQPRPKPPQKTPTPLRRFDCRGPITARADSATTMASDEEKQERKEGEEENLGEEKMKTARLEEEEADATAAYEAIEAETEASLVELSRSERKRHREKKRRSDVNRGLDQLMDLVFLIDPELKLEAEDRAQKASGGRTTSSDPPLLSRVELINSAVATLERVHRENEERKMVIAHLARGLLAGGNGNGSGGADAAAAAAAPLPPNSMQSAFPTPRDIQVRSPCCVL